LFNQYFGKFRHEEYKKLVFVGICVQKTTKLLLIIRIIVLNSLNIQETFYNSKLNLEHKQVLSSKRI